MQYYKVTEEFIQWANSDLEFMRKYIELQLKILKILNESNQIDSISSKL